MVYTAWLARAEKQGCSNENTRKQWPTSGATVSLLMIAMYAPRTTKT